LEAAPAGPVPVRGVAVLLPGFTGSKEDFTPLLSPMAAAAYRVISYDQRGQYESAGPDRARAYSIALFTRDLREVIGAVSNGEPVHLVGHSFGGLVARNLAIAEPALVRSLTLLDSGPGGASLLRARWLGLLIGLIRLCGPVVFAALVVEASRWAGVPAGRLPWLRYRLAHTQRAGLVGMCLALSGEPDRVDELASTPVPVLVIVGENDDVWSPQAQEEMARRLNAPIAIIKNAGHTPNEDQPEATAGAMLRFWNSAGRGP
jgi:pimeloyl-ACP methyl ester carboxylesterase